MDWSTSADLEAQVRRLWDRGRLLTGADEGGPSFPLALRLRRPDSSAMSERFDDVRRWIRELEENSKTRRGFGYDILWAEIDHRQLGRNRIPTGALVPTREDALRLLGKQRQADRFARLAALTLDSCPELRAWIEKKPKTLLDHAEDWEKILAVLAWFRAHPRPGVYLRQLDVAGVDTKFIEARKGLLMELLDIVLPKESIDASAKRDFEGRYGLLSKPPRVRFRILDREHYIGGLSDITVPASQFAELEPSVRRVFITENEINGLAFPYVPDAAVIFGLGYAIERLADVRWLRDRTIHYWGDIDTHGFAILDRLRAAFPEASSLLMDRETLMQHQSLWVQEETPHLGPLPRLSADEQDVFEALVADRFGVRVRLEQERVGYGWVTRALETLAS
ncbi:MAG: hypothetical protein BGO98_11110 [Myxococcales bacterium 68-20]|nr:hypothetical protein [Myxococcales bacterium]OJY16740.1 MAG: hypothetical protein BGO98_11110 [Myxococcales bacterium 68-20]